jgi:hypothetical protein
MTANFGSNDEILACCTHYKPWNPYSGYNPKPLKWEYPRQRPNCGDTMRR